jgi:putative ABC transport system ATP-binding protein
MITGIDHPSAGRVRVGDADVHHMKEGQLAEWRGRTLGVVFQFFQLLPMLSVLENTLLPMDFCNVYNPGEREERAMELLEMLGLTKVADQLPAALSGGQQQIAAIARALANDPPILLADEPTGNLDSRTAERVLDIFSNLASQGKTILIVTHDPSLARRTMRQILIADGEMVDENVARALPMLNHTQLLAVTHQATRRSFDPGASIAPQDETDDGLFLVTQGQVEVLRNKQNQPELVAELQAGQHFYSLDLAGMHEFELEYRAWLRGPVEVLWLSGKALQQLIAEAPKVGSAIYQAARERSQHYYQSMKSGKEGSNHVAASLG